MSSRVLVPILADLTGIRILFVGAGEGTRTKLEALAPLGPLVRVVAPRVSDPVRALVVPLDAQVFERSFTEADLDGVGLVFAFTDDPGVNAQVAALCRDRGLWSNVAGQRKPGSFTSPAVARKDGIIAAFSSETAEPAKAVAARNAWRDPCTCP